MKNPARRRNDRRTRLELALLRQHGQHSTKVLPQAALRRCSLSVLSFESQRTFLIHRPWESRPQRGRCNSSTVETVRIIVVIAILLDLVLEPALSLDVEIWLRLNPSPRTHCLASHVVGTEPEVVLTPPSQGVLELLGAYSPTRVVHQPRINGVHVPHVARNPAIIDSDFHLGTGFLDVEVDDLSLGLSHRPLQAPSFRINRIVRGHRRSTAVRTTFESKELLMDVIGSRRDGNAIKVTISSRLHDRLNQAGIVVTCAHGRPCRRESRPLDPHNPTFAGGSSGCILHGLEVVFRSFGVDLAIRFGLRSGDKVGVAVP